VADKALGKLSKKEIIELKESERFEEGLIRSTMMSRTSGKSFNELDDLDTLEPERDHLTIKAKIKLRVIKKYKEDESKKKEIEDYQKEVKRDREARGEENYGSMAMLNKRPTKHAPLTRRMSFTEF
jgi:hypothetical protein